MEIAYALPIITHCNSYIKYCILILQRKPVKKSSFMGAPNNYYKEKIL